MAIPVAVNQPTYWQYWGVSQQMHLILQVSTTVERLLSPKRNHNRPSFLLLQRKFRYPQFCADSKTIALLDCIPVSFLYALLRVLRCRKTEMIRQEAWAITV